MLEHRKSNGSALSEFGEAFPQRWLVAWLAALAVVGWEVGGWGGGHNHSPTILRLAEASLVVLTSVATLLDLARRFSWQNALTTFVLATGVFAGTAFAMVQGMALVGGGTSVNGRAQEMVGRMPGLISLFGAVLVLNSRGLAALILPPRRGNPNYGLWLMGLASLLTLTPGMGLFWGTLDFDGRTLATESDASAVAGMTVGGAAWLFAALAAQFVCLPWLIQKRPGEPPLSFQPGIVWLVLNLWIMIRLAGHGLRLPALLLAAASAFTVWFAAKGMASKKKHGEPACVPRSSLPANQV